MVGSGIEQQTAVATHSNTAVNVLAVEHVTKSFKQGDNHVVALCDVSFSARAGEFVAIMGASGSGKSTLLHLIAGLTRPDSGQVFVGGVDLAALRDPKLTFFRRENIGLVFQSFNLIPTLTAEDNVLLPVLAGGKPGTLNVDELLRRVCLENRRHHRPDAMSGGEQQRVAIARALHSDAGVLLADEPTGSLDSVTGQKICSLLKELNTTLKRTVVVVTHEPAVARWADRVVVLKDGQTLTEFDTAGFPDAQALAVHYHRALAAPSIPSPG